jgi:hypothetical protein
MAPRAAAGAIRPMKLAGASPMLAIVVTPLARYKARSSRVSEWTCMSTSPGESHSLPRPSIFSAPSGTGRRRPIAATSPSRTITVCPLRTRSESIGTTFTSTKAVTLSVATEVWADAVAKSREAAASRTMYRIYPIAVP